MFLAPRRLILPVRGMAGGIGSTVTNFGIAPLGRTDPTSVAKAGDCQPYSPDVRTTAPAAVIRKNVRRDSSSDSVDVGIVFVMADLASASSPRGFLMRPHSQSRKAARPCREALVPNRRYRRAWEDACAVGAPVSSSRADAVRGSLQLVAVRAERPDRPWLGFTPYRWSPRSLPARFSVRRAASSIGRAADF